ncbi:MAG: glycosyltransferase [Burkholderiales bacterium]|nr:glycosyltransferase [Phycisphaerae bacterium]
MSSGISVVVPVYNSQDCLDHLIARLEPVLRGLSSPFELILVNDGSRDKSWDVIERISKQHEWVRGINLMRNYGQHNTLLCGIRAARYELTVTIDDDLQNPPEEIPRMIEKLNQGYEVVYGTPEKEQHGIWRDMASVITKSVLKHAMGAETAGNVSAYRVFRTELRKGFVNYQSPFVSIDVLLTWASSKFTAVIVKHDARTVGVSNYTFKKLIIHALNMLTGFSTWPLKFASFIGFSFTLFGLGILGYVILRYLISGSTVTGFPFLASIIAIFSGAQLFALGIMGEYLSRMHHRMMERPTYAIKTTTGTEK